MSNINPKNKKGISVLYVVFIMSILLAIGFGLSGILVQQIKMLGEIGYSVVAFYAADSGIEKVLVDRQAPNLTPGYYNSSLVNGATYEVFVVPSGGSCSALNFCIKSIGRYQKVKRAIEINY